MWALGQYILDCNGEHDVHNPVCSLSPYNPPPATIEHYTFAPTWAIFVIAVVAIIVIIAIAIVRYRRHERLEAEHRSDDEVEIAKAARKTTSCPTCGTVYVPEGKTK